MNKKQLIAKLLDKLSEEDLMELLGDEPEQEQEEEQQTFNTHIHSTRSEGSSNRRKGRGNSKAKAQGKTGRSGKRKSKKSGRSKGSRGKSCRVMPMDLDSPRENKFEEMIGSSNLDANERVELSKASAEDEQARSQRTNFKKPARQSSLVDVDCCVCGDEYEVSATLVSNIDRWKCNSCSTQAGW
jgi:hypothetical protein